jgi:DNA (cytosine-5)-methyltransferase 1
VIVLDGCCGAGGATVGYVRAGHTVYGVDSDPRMEKSYLKSGAAGFLCADILDTLRQPWIDRVDFIHVSPPCQFYSAMAACRPGLAKQYPDLIGLVRELLDEAGKPWIIENVEAAAPWLKDPVRLCAQMFRPGVLLYRHRLLEVGGGFPAWPRRPGRLRAPQGAAASAAGRTRCRPAGPATGRRGPPSAWPATSATWRWPAR